MDAEPTRSMRFKVIAILGCPYICCLEEARDVLHNVTPRAKKEWMANNQLASLLHQRVKGILNAYSKVF